MNHLPLLKRKASICVLHRLGRRGPLGAEHKTGGQAGTIGWGVLDKIETEREAVRL